MLARIAYALRGALVGAMAGAVSGLADQFLRSVDPALAASPTAALAVALYWIVVLVPPATLIGALFGRRVRWSDALVAGLAFVALVGGYVNQRWLPGLLDPASLLFDGILVVATAVVVVLAARSPYRFDVRGRISALILVGVLVGTWLASSSADRGTEGRSGPGPVAGPDVLVVLLDALRADHCSAWGYERETTPVLDGLAAEGVLFERTYSVSSWTKPVVASLFSGLYPTRHGNHAINSLLPDEVVTVPEVYAGAGYRTAVFAENNFVSPLFGFDQGVGHFEGSDPSVYTQTILGHVLDQVAARVGGVGALVGAARVLDRFDAGQRRFSEDGIDLPGRVVDWVGRLDGEERFFAYVHLLKPHAPYVVPERFEGLWSGPGSEDFVRPPHVEGVDPFARSAGLDPQGRAHLVDNYDERIRFGDAQLGRIVEGIRETGRDPLVVVLSDHGEEFGHNGLYDHGHSLQEGVVRVPLVMTWPGHLPGGLRVTAVTRLIDLPPTLLAWSGLGVPEAFDGEPIDDVARAENRPVLLELEHGPGYGMRALLRDRLKLVRSEQGGRHAQRLFDLERDPGEQSSVAVEGEDPLVWMADELDALVGYLQGRGTVAGRTGLDPATEERLRALGYIR